MRRLWTYARLPFSCNYKGQLNIFDSSTVLYANSLHRAAILKNNTFYSCSSSTDAVLIA